MNIYMFTLDNQVATALSKASEMDQTILDSDAKSGATIASKPTITEPEFTVYRRKSDNTIVSKDEAWNDKTDTLLEGFEAVKVTAVTATGETAAIAYVAAANSADAVGKLKTAELAEFGGVSSLTKRYELVPYIFLYKCTGVDGIIPIHAPRYEFKLTGSSVGLPSDSEGKTYTKLEIDEILRLNPKATYELTYKADKLPIFQAVDNKGKVRIFQANFLEFSRIYSDKDLVSTSIYTDTPSYLIS